MQVYCHKILGVRGSQDTHLVMCIMLITQSLNVAQGSNIMLKMPVALIPEALYLNQFCGVLSAIPVLA